MNGKTIEDLAAAGYYAYCKQAGGVTFDNKMLPHWSVIGENRQACWMAAAKEVIAQNAAPAFVASTSPVDGYSLQATRLDDSCTTLYQFAAPAQAAAAGEQYNTFASGGGGDFGGGGASSSYDSSSSDSGGGSGSSDSSSSSSD
jgi:hypothetical protein